MRAFPPQGEEAFGNSHDIALALAEHLHVADLVVAHNAGHDRAAEHTETLRRKEAREPKCPLAHECANRAPSEPPEKQAASGSNLLGIVQLLALGQLGRAG